jgi:hypothetical protein
VAMFLIIGIETIFNTEFVGTCVAVLVPDFTCLSQVVHSLPLSNRELVRFTQPPFCHLTINTKYVYFSEMLYIVLDPV